MDEQMAIIESVRSKLNGFALHKFEESLKKLRLNRIHKT